MIYSFYKAFFITILGVLVLLGSGCIKGVTPTPVVPKKDNHVQGLWIGTASNATISIPYFLTLKPDGTCSFEGISAGNQEDFGVGTWVLTDSTVTCSVITLYGLETNIGVKQNITGVFHSASGTLTGLTWTDIAPATDQGTFSLTKANDHIHGVWAGTASNATITIPYFLTLKPDGTCSFEGISAGNQEDFGIGTWTLNGSALTCSLTTLYGLETNIGVKQTVTGMFDGSALTLTGLTWTDIAPATDQGTFSLTKTE